MMHSIKRLLQKAMLVGFLIPHCLLAQSVPQPSPAAGWTLESVLKAAEAAYPSTRQLGLVDSLRSYSLDNLQKNFLPQISFGAQWTYQSDVTQVKIPLPGVVVTPLNKDQYKLQAEISQLVYDGGMTRSQQALQNLSSGVEKQKWELELYRLRDRVRQLYVGVLFFDEQLKQVELAQSDLQTGINKTKALVENGLAFQSALLLLKSENLKLGQRKTELSAGRKGLLAALSQLLMQPLSENTQFETPLLKEAVDEQLNRPELHLLEQQSLLAEGQLKLIDAKSRPKASFFAQGGYGRPGLNFLKNDPALFYIGGLRINWSLSSLYTRKNEIRQSQLLQQSIALQQDQFSLQTRAQEKQQDAEIEKLEKLLQADDEIISLREQINVAVKAQLENGVITASDYLREMNATDQARQTKASHLIQLLQAKLNKETILGN